MRCESRYRLWLPSAGAGVIAVAAIFWVSSHEGIRTNSAVRGDAVAAEPSAEWWPRASEVPANAIKFYLVFSQSMTEGDIFNHLKLERREDGNWRPVDGAFRESELWSPDTKRLTVWLHPGRQKTGVNLNEEEGPVLVPGQRYQLVLRKVVTTQTGQTLPQDVTLSFTATEADHSCPDPKRWTVEPPKVRDASLRVLFDEPLDWAMLPESIWVESGAGERLSGQVMVDPNGTGWTFAPAKPWQPGPYKLRINPELEDLAGNNLLRPFETDAVEAKGVANAGPLEIGFEVKP